MAAIVKTVAGLALASVKTVPPSLVAASLKTINGQDATAAASNTVTLAGSQQTNNTLAITVTIAAAIASGQGIYVLIWGATAAVTNFVSIVDAGGNTYTKRTNANDASNGNSLITATAPASVGLNIGNTIVVTLGTQTDWYVFVGDLSSFTGYDVGTGQANAFGTSHTTGATAAMSGTNDAAIAAFANFGQVWTSTWASDAAFGAGTYAMGSRNIMLRTKTVTSGAQTATATTGSGVASAALIDCMKY